MNRIVSNSSSRGLTRREIIAMAGASGLALAGGARGAFAAGAENTIKIGFISPRSGALGGAGARLLLPC